MNYLSKIMGVLGCLMILLYIFINGTWELPLKEMSWMLVVGVLIAFGSLLFNTEERMEMKMMTNLVAIKDAFTDKEIALFEEKYLPTIKQYAECVKQKKAFEEQEKKFKTELGKIMDELGIKSMDCPFVKFTRIAAGEDKTTLDIDALKEKEPELFDELIADYPKIVKGKSAYVTFSVK